MASKYGKKGCCKVGGGVKKTAKCKKSKLTKASCPPKGGAKKAKPSYGKKGCCKIGGGVKKTAKCKRSGLTKASCPAKKTKAVKATKATKPAASCSSTNVKKCCKKDGGVKKVCRGKGIVPAGCCKIRGKGIKKVRSAVARVRKAKATTSARQRYGAGGGSARRRAAANRPSTNVWGQSKRAIMEPGQVKGNMIFASKLCAGTIKGSPAAKRSGETHRRCVARIMGK